MALDEGERRVAFFLELFSEEIPARMQAGAAAELERRVKSHLAVLQPMDIHVWSGPRRIALAASLTAEAAPVDREVRGPRVGAPAIAVDGFLKKNGFETGDLIERDGFLLGRKREDAEPAAEVIKLIFVGQVATLPWPKSMRWGQSGDFTWVRPLRRVVCLLDGAVVPIVVGPVTASDQSEGHRFLAPGAFAVTAADQWEAELGRRCVVADAGRRATKIEAGLREAAAAQGVTVLPDAGLLGEVSGLVEWPVALVGRIETRFMALPPEVRELSMKVNQRYFATRDGAGTPAPFFAFVANIEAADGGAAIIAGNERVLRARLADAEHFWNLDRQVPLEDYLPKLKSVVFHAKLGSQFERAERIAAMAGTLCDLIGHPVTAGQRAVAIRAGRLCKADLVTGMVGEFPELQGIMGGYYADDPEIGRAIGGHYQPKGPADAVPEGLIGSVVALADKLDTLTQFFRIGEKPSGSGDPYALRRAALGVIRIIVENDLRLSLNNIVMHDGLFEFIIERLRVKLRGEGRRFDILDAVLAKGMDGDLVRVMRKIAAIERFIGGDDSADLVAAYRRAANILRIEAAKDGPYTRSADPAQLVEATERELAVLLATNRPIVRSSIEAEDFAAAMTILAGYRQLIDRFFADVTVNVDDPALRLNRLFLLNDFVRQFDQLADFSKLEG